MRVTLMYQAQAYLLLLLHAAVAIEALGVAPEIGG